MNNMDIEAKLVEETNHESSFDLKSFDLETFSRLCDLSSTIIYRDNPVF